MAKKKTSRRSNAKKGTRKRSTKKAAPRAHARKRTKMSQMDAAARVLTEAGEPMNCKAMVEAMQKKGYWKSPGGKTPAATLYASILRDLKKGKDARFKKVDRGLFDLK